MQKKINKIVLDMADAISLNESTAFNYLESKGVNIDYYIKKGIKEIRKVQFVSKANANIELHQQLLSQAIQYVKKAIPETISDIESLIRQKNPSFQFRNLQELNDIQLKEILEDFEILNFIEQKQGNGSSSK